MLPADSKGPNNATTRADASASWRAELEKLVQDDTDPVECIVHFCLILIDKTPLLLQEILPLAWKHRYPDAEWQPGPRCGSELLFGRDGFHAYLGEAVVNRNGTAAVVHGVDVRLHKLQRQHHLHRLRQQPASQASRHNARTDVLLSEDGGGSVSYTHLTLPTIYSV